MQQVLMDLPQGKTINDVCEVVWKLDCAIKPGLIPTQITVLTAEGVSVQQVRDAIGPVNEPVKPQAEKPPEKPPEKPKTEK